MSTLVPVVGFAENDAVTPLGRTDVTARFTLPANPVKGVTVIVEDPEPPWVIGDDVFRRDTMGLRVVALADEHGMRDGVVVQTGNVPELERQVCSGLSIWREASRSWLNRSWEGGTCSP
ncbi:MAG: hypothetical protein ABR905_05330, partial [Terracidiphilus sp.]